MATHGCNVPVSPLTLFKWYFGTAAAAAAKACDWAAANCAFSLLTWVFAVLPRWSGFHSALCRKSVWWNWEQNSDDHTNRLQLEQHYSITIIVIQTDKIIARRGSELFILWDRTTTICCFLISCHFYHLVPRLVKPTTTKNGAHCFPAWHSVFRLGLDPQMIPKGQHGSFSACPYGTNMVSFRMWQWDFNRAGPATCPCSDHQKICPAPL